MDTVFGYMNSTYMRGTGYMGTKDKKKKNNSEEKIEDELTELVVTRDQEKDSAYRNSALTLKKWIEHPIFSNIVAPLLVILICYLTIDSVRGDIEELETKMSTIQTSSISAESSINLVGSRLDSIESRFNNVENVIYSAAMFRPVSADVISLSQNSVTDEYSLSSPIWDSDDVIATDTSSGVDMTAYQLIGQKLLLPYEENGQEIIFYGQYNSNYHWEGNCIINIYKNDDLMLIMEAFYDDGKLLFYKQVLPYITKGGIKAWNVSTRTNVDEYNIGDSWSYYRDEYKKNFSIDNVVISDVLHVNDFKDKYCKKLEGFYHGNTSNGKYNDNTGGAYMIKFAEDGTVRTLYSGNFKDGHYDDSTGNAWYITRDEKKETVYMYYKGEFANDKPIHDKGCTFEHGISIDRINEILDNRLFAMELNWHEIAYSSEGI